jgi:hypothetical protein
LNKEARDGPEAISGRKSPRGEIILNTPLRRAVFLAGLIGTVCLVIMMMLFR